MWDPIASVVNVTNLLAIIPTQTSMARRLGSSNAVSGGYSSSLLRTLSDVSIPVDLNNQYGPSLLYNPSAEYRLIDMNSVMNLNKVDIVVFWKDVFGGIHPLKLQPGCSAHVKLMFRKKDFNNAS